MGHLVVAREPFPGQCLRPVLNPSTEGFAQPSPGAQPMWSSFRHALSGGEVIIFDSYSHVDFYLLIPRVAGSDN